MTNVKCQMNGCLRPILFKIIIPSLVIFNLSFVISSGTFAAEFDGIWFLGFNLKNKPFNSLEVRQAVSQSLSETVPASIVPPTMLGYDPDLETAKQDVSVAKKLMKKAGYPINDPRLKTIKLVRTDGLVTESLANNLAADLSAIGIKITQEVISYKAGTKWEETLISGNYDLFLMGYKSNLENLFSTEAKAEDDSYSLIEPLFKTKAEANFTGYSNKQVDKLLGQLSGINMALKAERHKKLKQINQILYKDLPIIVLFYIEKL